MILKGFKYRIYPNQEQSQKIAQHLGCVRYIYNKALETKIKVYQTKKEKLTCFQLTTGLLKDQKQNMNGSSNPTPNASRWLSET